MWEVRIVCDGEDGVCEKKGVICISAEKNLTQEMQENIKAQRRNKRIYHEGHEEHEEEKMGRR